MMDPCRSRVEEFTEPWHRWVRRCPDGNGKCPASVGSRWIPCFPGQPPILAPSSKGSRPPRALGSTTATSFARKCVPSPPNDRSPQSAVCLLTHTSRRSRALVVGRSWGRRPLAGTEAPLQWVMQENGSLAASGGGGWCCCC